ncbi:MAG: hypothetical protein IJ008_01585 [Clostridia bacterium]|nr:hypothetical protein [Clostridia bacterium]
MQVTKENENLVRVFIRILNDKKVPRDAIRYVIAALQTEEQMDNLVDFIKNNENATEREILEEADRLINKD